MVLKLSYPCTCKATYTLHAMSLGREGTQEGAKLGKMLAREKYLHVSLAIVHPSSTAKSFIVWSPIIQACINVQDKQQVSSGSNDPIKVNRFQITDDWIPIKKMSSFFLLLIWDLFFFFSCVNTVYTKHPLSSSPTIFTLWKNCKQKILSLMFVQGQMIYFLECLTQDHF